MPELPEVEMVRRYVAQCCKGRIITNPKVWDNGILAGVKAGDLVRSVRGKKIIGAARHGKQLFIDLDDGLLTVHLGMTGDLTLLEERERLPPHARITLGFEDGTRLAYDDPRKFGAIGLARSIPVFVTEHRLGPDALKISLEEFVERARPSRRAIKAVILDQHVLAGVGNLYADEALFQAKVHPMAPANMLSASDLEEVHAKVRRALRASIKVSTDFSKLPGDFLLRSRVVGAPCRKGHDSLQALKVGGRTTIYCPSCQRL